MDISIRNEGSLYLLCPLTEAGTDWLKRNLAEDGQWWCGKAVVEPRYVEDIVRGAMADGLSIG